MKPNIDSNTSQGSYFIREGFARKPFRCRDKETYLKKTTINETLTAVSIAQSAELKPIDTIDVNENKNLSLRKVSEVTQENQSLFFREKIKNIKKSKVILKVPCKPQFGHICKIQAIYLVDMYYSKIRGRRCTPLFKYQDRTAETSLRGIAKKHGSIQGELLDSAQIEKIANEIGYSSEIIEFSGSYESFVFHVYDNLSKGRPLICCFAQSSLSCKPTTFNGGNEHAAVITGIDLKSNILYISHKNNIFKENLMEFYDSNMSLPEERNREFYYKTMNDKISLQSVGNYKYGVYNPEPMDYFIFSSNSALKKSIIPSKNTGFKGKLFVLTN